jgi:hypothetical protein
MARGGAHIVRREHRDEPTATMSCSSLGVARSTPRTLQPNVASSDTLEALMSAPSKVRTTALNDFIAWRCRSASMSESGTLWSVAHQRETARQQAPWTAAHR